MQFTLIRDYKNADIRKKQIKTLRTASSGGGSSLGSKSGSFSSLSLLEDDEDPGDLFLCSLKKSFGDGNLMEICLNLRQLHKLFGLVKLRYQR